MYKLLVVLAVVVCAAQAGLIGHGAVLHAPVAVAQPVALKSVAVAHAPVATSYANYNQVSHVTGIAVHQPVHAPAVAVKSVAVPVVAHAAPVAYGHGW